MQILLVEDEREVAQYVQENLENQGHRVRVCYSVEEVVKNSHMNGHDLVILDLILPGKKGSDLVEKIRKAKNSVPILVLSSLGQTSVKVDLLDLGVDDYMTKPFRMEELIARVNALHRRYMDHDIEDVEKYGNMEFFWKQNKLRKGNKEVMLTNKEGLLLRLLLKNHGKTVRTDDILQKVWEIKPGYHSNILHSMVRRLRKKLTEGIGDHLIRSVHGIGYSVKLPKED